MGYWIIRVPQSYKDEMIFIMEAKDDEDAKKKVRKFLHDDFRYWDGAADKFELISDGSLESIVDLQGYYWHCWED